MEAEVTRPVSTSSNNQNTRKISFGKNDRSSDELSSSPTDPLRRAQRRTSSTSLTSTTNKNRHSESHNGVQHSDPEPADGQQVRVGSGDENLLSINPTYKIPILGYEVMEERAKFTVFKLRVENEELNEHWLVFRRYTDFERLYAKLKEEYPLLAISLPPKRWLRDNFETAFLEERLKGLQAFVDSILLRHRLTQSPTVREFFCFDDPPLDYSENNAEVHLSLEENKLAGTVQTKQNEIDVLKTELLLMKTQYDNLLRLTKNCGHCNPQQRRSSITSPITHKKTNNNSASSSLNSSPKKHVENESKTSAKSRNSSTSSSTSTSYAEIPTKLSSTKDAEKSPRRSSTDPLQSTATDGINQPHAPPRKPRKSLPATTYVPTNTNTGRNAAQGAKESDSKQSMPISTLRDNEPVDLTPENDSSAAASGLIR